MIVSFNVSPFEELVTLGSVNPMTRAPNLFAAVSKLSRVRVEGSKKRVATTLPSKILRLGLLFKLFCHLQEVEDFLFRVFGNSN